MESVYLNGGFIGPTVSFGDTERYVLGGPAGEEEFTTPGTYSWTAPEGVTSVSVVCVGAGGGPAANTSGASGAGGGGLGWKNNISVTPGQSYTVQVGAGGTRVTSGTAPAGGNSFFINTSTVAGFGGLGGVAAADANRAGGSFTGDGGGNGGAGGSRSGSTAAAGGGGGAGGYSGNGGAGGNANATAGTLAGSGSGGGGGGGGRGGSADSAGSGGGVGIYGEGSNGSGGVNSGNDGGSGFGGSGGEDGNVATTTNPGNTYGTSNLSTPGLFGGGGCGADNTTAEQANGANGAVRIIWGDGRAFPSTNTADGAYNFGNQKNSGIWLLQSVYDLLATPTTSFPILENIVTTDHVSGSTISVNLPSNISSGDGILIIITQYDGGIFTTPSGWTQITNTKHSSSLSPRTAVYIKISDGTEGSTQNISSSAANEATAIAIRITNWFGSISDGIEGISEQQTTTNPTPPQLTASWGEDKNLWLVFVGTRGSRTLTSYPLGYDLYQVSAIQSSSNSGETYMAGKENETNLEIPSSFSFSSTAREVIVGTIVIRGG